MSASCPHHPPSDNAAHGGAPPPGYRRALVIALLVNAAMFFVEVFSGLASGSVSLLADAADFFGDAANYALSLVVLTMALRWRTRVAALKALSMAAFGVFVIGRGLWAWSTGVVPEPATMGIVGTLALAANLAVAVLLYAYRGGDANMQSVWLCTRNDALGNLAVLAAAAGVFGTGAAWPDLIVAAVMATLALSASRTVLLQVREELRPGHVAAADQAPHGNPAATIPEVHDK